MEVLDWYVAELAWREIAAKWGSRRQTFNVLRVAQARSHPAIFAAFSKEQASRFSRVFPAADSFMLLTAIKADYDRRNNLPLAAG